MSSNKDPKIGFIHVPFDMWDMLDADGYAALLVVARTDGGHLDKYDQDALYSMLGSWDEAAMDLEAGKTGESADAMRERRRASNEQLAAMMRADPSWSDRALPEDAAVLVAGVPAIGTASPPAPTLDGADWTTGPDGRANTSPRFEALALAVERIIRDSGFDLINGRAGAVAGLILAQLAHVHGLAPKETP